MTVRSTVRPCVRPSIYAVMGTEVLGDEIVLNGSFADASSWQVSVNWTIAAGVATHAAGSASAENQIITRRAPGLYRVTVDVSGLSAGQVFMDLWDTLIPGTVAAGTARTANGSYSQTHDAAKEFDNVRIKPDSAFVGAVDNVSVRQVIY